MIVYSRRRLSGKKSVCFANTTKVVNVLSFLSYSLADWSSKRDHAGRFAQVLFPIFTWQPPPGYIMIRPPLRWGVLGPGDYLPRPGYKYHGWGTAWRPPQLFSCASETLILLKL